MKNVSPAKIGNTLARNGFGFESKHTMTGAKYLMAER
jgi:hypothetical protein